jgi:hypothetical protein
MRGAVAACLLGGTAVVAPVFAPPAAAAADTTTIISPAGPGGSVYALAEGFGHGLTVTGSTSASLTPGVDTVQIYCFHDGNTRADDLSPNPVPISGEHAFTAMIKPPPQPCVLRAVPSTYTGIDATGHNIGDVRGFAGPNYYAGTSAHTKGAWRVGSSGRRAWVLAGSAASSGLGELRPFNDTTKTEGLSANLDLLSLQAGNITANGVPTRSEIRVDDHNAYTPATLASVARHAWAVPTAGYAAVFRGNGSWRVTETDPLSFCAGDAYPEVARSCTVEPSGVELKRVLTVGADGSAIGVRDAWISTDGNSHKVAMEYGGTLTDLTTDSAGWIPPGVSGFVAPEPGALLHPVAGRVSTVFTTNNVYGRDGSLRHAVVGLSYSAPATLVTGRDDGHSLSWGLRYLRMVTPSSTVHLGFAVADGTSLSQVKARSARLRAGLWPQLHLNRPARGARLHRRAVTVGGLVTNPVNGEPRWVVVRLGRHARRARVSPKGHWSMSLRVPPGRHRLTARASDPAGLAIKDAVVVRGKP